MNCHICYNKFDHSSHKPHSLSHCSHSFCIECIKCFRRRKCPLCLKSFKATHVNLCLLELIPESTNSDKTIFDLEKIYDEVINLKLKLNKQKETKLQYISREIEQIKWQISSLASETINRVKLKKNYLLDELKSYEKKCTESIQTNFDATQMVRKLETIRAGLNDFKNFEKYYEDMKNFKNELNENIRSLSNIEAEIDFHFVVNYSDPVKIGEFYKNQLVIFS